MFRSMKNVSKIPSIKIWYEQSEHSFQSLEKFRLALREYQKQKSIPLPSTYVSPAKWRDPMEADQANNEKNALESAYQAQVWRFKEAEKQFFLQRKKALTLLQTELKFKNLTPAYLEALALQRDQSAKATKNPLQQSIYKLQYQAVQSILNNGVTTLFIPNRLMIASLIKEAAERIGLEVIIGHQAIDKFTPAIAASADENKFELKSYHDVEEIQQKALEIAEQRGKLAFHPGIGFTAENKDVAEFCEKNGIQFIGPSSKCMDIFSNKAHAKEWVKKMGLTIPKSYHSSEKDTLETLTKAARNIGYPIMLKIQKLGGGGTGNRIAHNDEDLAQAFSTLSSRGDLTMEAVIQDAEHIELQFVIEKERARYLGARNCSVVIRFQKFIERSETNRSHLTKGMLFAEIIGPGLHRMGYRGPITAEFLVTKDGHWYFIECNTRLQVEHPITNHTAKVDLVEYGLKAVLGRSYTHELARVYSHPASNNVESDIAKGLMHAVLTQKPIRQIRISASDTLIDTPKEGELFFAPLKGKITHLDIPQKSEKGYVQLGIQNGTELDYQSNALDPQIGAVYGFGKTQAEADKHAIELARQLVVHINGQKHPLNLEFACFALEYINTHRIPERIETGHYLAKKYVEHCRVPTQDVEYSLRPGC